MPNDLETIAPVATEPTVTSPEQENTEPLVTSPDDGQLDTIPEKFRGKTSLDIIRSYQALERHKGELASERSKADKENEDLKKRIAEIEARQATTPEPQYQQAPQPQAQQQDPLSSFDTEFDRDPKEAIKRALAGVHGNLQAVPRYVETHNRARAADDFYQTQMRDNPDFRAREPEMQRLAKALGPMIKPEFVQSPEMIRHLYTLARGEKLNDYVAAEVTKAKKAGDLVRDEKKAAFSESSVSKGDTSVNYDDMTSDEMASYLTRVG